MPDKVTARFKQILSELPEDKKRALYKRLSGIPADGRDSFIRQFVLKYDAGNTVKPKMNGSKHADRNIGRRVTAIVAAVLSLILIVKIISRRNDIAQMFSSFTNFSLTRQENQDIAGRLQNAQVTVRELETELVAVNARLGAHEQILQGLKLVPLSDMGSDTKTDGGSF